MAENTELSQYVPGFTANLNLAPQQTDSKLVNAVESELNYSTPGTMFNADDVGQSDPEDDTTRVPDTPDKFLDKTRRVGWFLGFRDSAWLDNVDKAAELVDPTNPTMAALMAGRWRKTDDGIMGALLGPAYEKADENSPPTPVAFPSANVIAANDVTHAHQDENVPGGGADYGMSVGKLIYASEILDEAELEGERYVAMTSVQRSDLLRSTPTTSQYYTDVKALVAGTINEFMGFKFIRLPKKRVLTVDGSPAIRRCVAWIKPALIYKARTIENASIRIRHDKSDTPQAFYRAQHGGVRRYDAGVVEIRAKEG
jgi:Phage capsid protein